MDALNRTLGDELFVDKVLLFGQIGVLLWILLSELLKQRRNLLLIGVSVALLVLVQAQAWWTFSFLSDHGWLVHYGQTVSLYGARLANVYTTLFVAAFVGATLVARKSVPTASPPHRMAAESAAARLVIWIWVILASGLVVVTVGGFGLLVTEPGRLIPGQTVFLVAVGLAKMPMLRAIVAGERPRAGVVWLFALAFAVTLFNSRFLSLFLVLQAFILLNYCRRELSRLAVFSIAVVTFLVVIVYGLYRDFANHVAGAGGLGLQSLPEYEFSRMSDGLITWFYMWNDESFVGLAKILSYEHLGAPIDHDWGLSELSVLTQLLPNSIRHDPGLPFQAIVQSLQNAYPYHGSIVPPGLEMAYAHFGPVGIVVFGVVLGYLVQRSHRSVSYTHLTLPTICSV